MAEALPQDSATLAEYLVRRLVDAPDEVVVTRGGRRRASTSLRSSVAEDDRGKVIGRQGPDRARAAHGHPCRGGAQQRARHARDRPGMTARRPDRVRLGTAGKAHGLDGTFGVDGALRVVRVRARLDACSWTGVATASAAVAGTDGSAAGRARRHRHARGRRGAARQAARAGARRRAARPRRTPSTASTWSAARCCRASARLGEVTEVEDGVAHDISCSLDSRPAPAVRREAVVPGRRHRGARSSSRSRGASTEYG